jgi:hypothetical protein
VGRFWIQPSTTEHAIIGLDVSIPILPREVGALVLGDTDAPHWVAAERRRSPSPATAGSTRALMNRIDYGRSPAPRRRFHDTGRGAAGRRFRARRWPRGAT